MVAMLMAVGVVTAAPAQAATAGSDTVKAGVDSLAGGSGDRLVVTFDANVSVGALNAATDVAELTKAGALDGSVKTYELSRVVSASDAVTLENQLEDVAGVVSVAWDKQVQHLETNDTHWSALWNMHGSYGVDVETAWQHTQGDGAVVAIVDTGVLPNHEDLSGQTVPGYDFISDTTVSGDGDGRDSDPSDPGDAGTDTQCGAGNGSNSSWHGSHIAGIIAGKKDNNAGIAGIAPQAKIQAVRVLGVCGGSLSEAIMGVKWAAGLPVPGAPVNANPVRVINLSLGTSGACPAWVQAELDDVAAAGVLVVVAAGNENTDAALKTPASCNNVMTVASVSVSGARSSFSNYGSVVDIAAPGSSIISTVDSGTTGPVAGTYAYKSGTSMATPHVAAVAALVLSLQPALPLADLRTRILSNTKPFDFATTCSLSCGSGIVNAGLAVTATADLVLPSAPLNVTTSVEATGVRVSWTAPASSGESAISRYDVTANGTTGCFTSGMSCIVEALALGATHTFVVRASNSLGAGRASTAVTATFGNAPGGPASVTAVRNETSAVVSWQAPVSNGGAGIDGYNVSGSLGGTCSTTGLTCTVVGLAPGSTNSFSVTAYNAAGTSATATSNVVVIPAGSSVPVRVETVAGYDNIFVAWAAGTGGLAAASYTVVLSPGGVSCTTTGLSCPMNGLLQGVTYTVAVSSAPLIGAVGNAAAVTATTLKETTTTQPPTTTTPVAKSYSMKKGAKVVRTKIITTKALGKRTWYVSGGCRFSGTYVVAPKRNTTCTLKLKLTIGKLSTTVVRSIKVS